MANDEIIQYYDDLIRLATSKCNSQTDVEDLVGDTMLAAFAYMQRGGGIEHPKTWLIHTLYHKHNDNLRKKYRSPVTVCLDENAETAAEEDEEYFTFEEASKVRKELNHLNFITREVLIRFYFGNQRVADIAEGLGIPAAYIEPIIKKLVDGELMVQMDSGKVYTDFIITGPQNSLNNFKPQLDFAHKHFETIWKIIERMSDLISKMSFVKEMSAEGRLCIKIPVIKKTEYDELCTAIKNATEEIKVAIGEEFTTFIASMKTPIPKHLTSVPELFRYHEATKYFVMSVVREAYDKGLHLQGVDYCCPPTVLVYEM